MAPIKPKTRRVGPLYRFSHRVYGKRILREGGFSFGTRSHYYHCPRCSRKTLVERKKLDWFNPPPSIFPPDLQALFDTVEIKTNHATFDFYCKKCAAPVRLLFDMHEIGMGGPWYSVVHGIFEIEDD